MMFSEQSRFCAEPDRHGASPTTISIAAFDEDCNIGVALASAHQLDLATTSEPTITQIAEALAGERPPNEILNTIIEQRRSFAMAELTELLDRAKELQAQAEELQRKAAILMEVLAEIVKSAG